MTFNNWIDIFLSEKEISGEIFEVEHNEMIHYIEQEILIDFVKSMPADLKKQIKNTFVMIDFKNGNVRHYLNHLAAGFVNATRN